MRIERIRIDAFGRLSDFEIAAEIVKGRQVAPGTRFIVTPGSQAILKEAIQGMATRIAVLEQGLHLQKREPRLWRWLRGGDLNIGGVWHRG